ncbi:MAG: hypothetical protein AAFW82_10685 [Pseudomonadota bacterium]
MAEHEFNKNPFQSLNAFLKTGVVADSRYGLVLPLEVIRLDENVFVIGTTDPNGALFTRESRNSYTTAEKALKAIETGEFQQNFGFAEAPLFDQSQKPGTPAGPVMYGEAFIGPIPHPNGGVE